MPPISRPQRQVAATLALVAFTMAPTAYLTWMAVQVRRPSHLREVEAQVGRALGLSVLIEAVRYPRPGEVVLRGVRFSRPEPRGPEYAEVANAKEVRFGRADRELRVQAGGLRVRGDGPRQAVEGLAALLGRGVDGSWDRLSLLAPACRVELGPGGAAFDLDEVVATYHEDRGAPTVSASFRVVEQGTSSRCELVLTRDRQGPVVRHRLKVATKEGDPLPARVLDPFFDAASWLGSKARVQGLLALSREEGSEWSAEFQGALSNVDLAALIDRRFGDHRMSGLARVEVRSARWGDRGPLGFGWVEAEGRIAAGQGSISRGLVDALGRQLGLQTPGSIAPLGPDLPFQALGLTFAMTADGGLKLGGDLGPEHPRDAVLVDPRRAIALAPRDPGDVRGLVRALFPVAGDDPAPLVPGDRDSASVQRYLPAPAALAAGPGGSAR
jgi:hypothetical protein